MQPYAGGAFCLKGTDTAGKKPGKTRRPSLSFRNCGLFNNTAEGPGGAIYTSRTDIHVIDSIVRDNKAYSGGAFYVENAALNSIRSNFTGNSAVELGGAAFASQTDVLISDSIMDGNSAVSGGALFDKESTVGSSTLNCLRTRFTRNSASREGGAILSKSPPVSCLILVHLMRTRQDFVEGLLTWILDPYLMVPCSRNPPLPTMLQQVVEELST